MSVETNMLKAERIILVNTVAPHVRCCIQNLENIEEAVQISKCFDSLCLHLNVLKDDCHGSILLSRNFHLLCNDNSNQNCNDSTEIVSSGNVLSNNKWIYPVRARVDYDVQDLINVAKSLLHDDIFTKKIDIL